MILVDHDLSKLIADSGIIQEDTFSPDCITNIGYDLRTKAFYDDDGEHTSKSLAPGESVMVSTEEIINMPVRF